MEAWIREGRIQVNGQLAHIGQRVSADDHLSVDGRRVKSTLKAVSVPRVLIYNKPEGEVCTRHDPEGRPTVFQHFPHLKQGRWISVGRLDLKTTGLLLITNDGELAHYLMHPSSDLEREYMVRVYGEVTPTILKRLCNGVRLSDGMGRFNQVSAQGPEGLNRWFRVSVSEGRNQFIRRMWMFQGLQVTRLRRIRYGPLILPRDLAPGKLIELTSPDCLVLAQSLVPWDKQ